MGHYKKPDYFLHDVRRAIEYCESVGRGYRMDMKDQAYGEPLRRYNDSLACYLQALEKPSYRSYNHKYAKEQNKIKERMINNNDN